MSYKWPGYRFVEGDALSCIKRDVSIMPDRTGEAAKAIAGKDVVWLIETIGRMIPKAYYGDRNIDTDGTEIWSLHAPFTEELTSLINVDKKGYSE